LECGSLLPPWQRQKGGSKLPHSKAPYGAVSSNYFFSVRINAIASAAS
jgi:hypothetical protein